MDPMGVIEGIFVYDWCPTPGDLYVASTFFFQKLTAGGVERYLGRYWGLYCRNAMRTIPKLIIFMAGQKPSRDGRFMMVFHISHIAVQLDRIGQPGSCSGVTADDHVPSP